MTSENALILLILSILLLLGVILIPSHQETAHSMHFICDKEGWIRPYGTTGLLKGCEKFHSETDK